jgi:hypothetical protein
VAYHVSLAQKRRIQILMEGILADLFDPTGSSLDPAVLEKALRTVAAKGDQRRGRRMSIDIEAARKHEPFLYLRLSADDLAQSIDTLGFSPGTRSHLMREDISTLEDLLERSESELLGIRMNAGRVEEIKRLLSHHGWYLSPHDRGIAAPPGDRWVTIKGYTWQVSRLHRVSILRLAGEEDQAIFQILEQYGIRTVADLLQSARSRIVKIPWGEHRLAPGYARKSSVKPEQVLAYIERRLQDHSLHIAR